MFAIRTFIHSSSIRSASIVLVLVCIGFLMGCSGDVASPSFNVSGSGFKIRIPDFTAEKIVDRKSVV